MYGKLFESELDSSIVESPPTTRLLWHYLIVLADEDGRVDITMPALARRVNLPLADVEAAIAELSSPDPHSRTPDDEGRRIVPLEGQPFGWQLVNHGKYRRIASREDRRRQNREAQRRHRESKGGSATVSNGQQRSAPVTRNKPSEAEAEAEAEAEGRGEGDRGRGVPTPRGGPQERGVAPPGPPAVEPDGSTTHPANGHAGDKRAEAIRARARERAAAEAVELDWRLQRVWADHLEARRRFYVATTGRAPGTEPACTKEIRKAIRDALREHDRAWLGAEAREVWAGESWVRAAGVGIFLDSWCTGTDRDNDATAGGKRYLEPWRAWKRQRGKPDPVPRFAEAYFDAKERP